VAGPAPTLAKLENEIGAALDEHRGEIVHSIAVALVQIAVRERAANAGNEQARGPRLCRLCRARLAADARTVCNSCRGRQRRERERLRDAYAAELANVANGRRGARAAELVNGSRADPAQPFNT
jgi:hypothetical protein